MGRPERPVDASGGAVAEFASELRLLRVRAGNPTYRDMARAAMYSASVLSSAASGHRLPTLQVALAYVAACGGDREGWQRRWQQVAGEQHGTAKPLAVVRPSLPRPAQLPIRPFGFVSRTGELRRLGAASTAPVVISGPAGVGKSELALHHAHDVAAADGQLYADFGLLGPDGSAARTVIDGFLRALGVPDGQLPFGADQRAGLYRSLLAERRLVVLLENVSCEQQVRPLLADARSSVTVVVGRAALLGLRGVRRLRLDVLPRADSIAMITAGVPDRAEAEPGECDRLAALCGDLPLALDIATRRLAARPGLPLRLVTGWLREPGAALDWLRIGDLSVRDSLLSAYFGLDDRARDLLDRLAGPAPERPGPQAGGSAVLVEDELLEELADAGMLRRGRGSGVYRMDPLVRALVADPAPYRLPAAPGGPSWAGRRHTADHRTRYADQMVPVI
ncbi:hypothetical protein KNE206_04260 [Kitasatospora sp. NE20-6]|uniref:XRE family transcriptional regulator n=1 Tax=Kitasatospora sp. NE20-6 TaxID=2859066 RepID=UPI0034DC235E